MRKSLWMVSVLTLCTTLPAGAVVVRAFGSGDGLGGGFDYSYGGSTWDPLSVSQVVGATFVEIGGAGAPGVTEQGGAGLFFGSRDLSVPGPVGILVEARFGALDTTELPGPDGFQVNFIPNGSPAESFFFDKSAFSGTEFVSVVVPVTALTAAQLADIQQVQIQGRDFSGTAGRFNWEFRRIETVTLGAPIVKGDFGGGESSDGSFNTPDGAFDGLDIEGFLLALNSQESYLALNPTLGSSLIGRGDFGGNESTDGSFNSPDGAFDGLDIEGFLLALNDPAGYAAIQPTPPGGVVAIPEPATLGLLSMLGVFAGRRRR